MPKRKVRYPEKPWIRDPAILKRWQALLGEPKKERTTTNTPFKPDKGWQLWDWHTLEDKPQE